MKTCRCGHDRGHHMVSVERKYNVWRWFLLMMGATQRPVRVEFKCRDCEQIFDEADDPATMALYAAGDK